jgi:RNA polymerase-binding transcription factor DksA
LLTQETLKVIEHSEVREIGQIQQGLNRISEGTYGAGIGLALLSRSAL